MTAAKGPPERVTLTLGAYPDHTPVEYVRADLVETRELALLAALQQLSAEGLLDCIDGDTPTGQRCGQCSCCGVAAALAAAGGKL